MIIPRTLEHAQMVEWLTTRFGVPQIEVRNMFRHQMRCQEQGSWNLHPAESEGDLIIERPDESVRYLIGTTQVKRLDKNTGEMVQSATIVMKRRLHRPQKANVGQSLGRNRSGHYLTPGSRFQKR